MLVGLHFAEAGQVFGQVAAEGCPRRVCWSPRANADLLDILLST
jgi:hypothetical protein